ncbi:DUF4349 domain-containing protein [Streptomyces sp. NPDC048248]|uniref:DUF4349 domain-containing protein n=1 Tax=Streptomyces sp. NPDC048248 TaxID=3365523 RepID=UPI00371AC350
MRGARRVRGTWGPPAGRRAATAGVLLAASLTVAGCGAAGEASTAGDARSDKGAVAPSQAAGGRYAPGGQRAGDRVDGGATAEDGTAASDGANGSDRDGKTAKAAAAQIIRTATVTVQTEDVPAAVAKARTAVDGAGGYVGDETTDQDSEGHDRSRIVLRVPPAEYDAVLARLSGLGKLVSRQVSAKDVTDQVVDVDSRIATQRASVARVRTLLQKATTISDIVSLESELTTRQANLESLQAQLKSLKDRTGTATVTLLLREPDAAPEEESDDPTSFGDALSGGWHAFTAAVRWVLVVIGAVLPFAVAGSLLYGLWRLIRNRIPAGLRRRRGPGGDTAKAALAQQPAGPVPGEADAAHPAADASAAAGARGATRSPEGG